MNTISRSIFLMFVFLMQTALFANAPAEKIEKLTPPVLNHATILKETICTRPMRDGRFNISAETWNGKNGEKKIVHCYGHGGSGWTTLWGSVGKAVKLIQNDPKAIEKPVRVIGSGCMGLASAIELKRLGYDVVGITTKELYDIASWRAAGYFALVSVKTSPEEQENLNQIGTDTFKTYQRIGQSQHPYITQDAVRYLPVYCSYDTESGVEDLEAQGLIPPKENVTLDFGNGVTHPHFVKYMTYFLDTTKLMRQLTAEVKKLGIPIEMGEVVSFDDVEENVIFNCTGLGARTLNSDENMIPVRGHLILPNEKSGTEHMNYMIYSKVYQDGKEEYIYMFPKAMAVTSENKSGEVCRSVIGGTFIPHADRLSPEELAKLDKREFKKMLDRNNVFFYGEAFAE